MVSMRSFIFVALLLPSLACADSIMYMDESGTIHFAESISQVPAQYRPQLGMKAPHYSVEMTEKERKALRKEYERALKEREKEAKKRQKEVEREKKQREKEIARERKKREKEEAANKKKMM